MYFFLYAQANDDAMKFEYPKFWNLIFSRAKQAVEVK